MADDGAVDERAVHLREEGRLLVERFEELGVVGDSLAVASDLVRRGVGVACLYLPKRSSDGQPLHENGPPGAGA